MKKVTDREVLDYFIDNQFKEIVRRAGGDAVTDTQRATLRKHLEDIQPPYLYDFPETFRGAPDQGVREKRHELMKEYKKEEEEDNYYR